MLCETVPGFVPLTEFDYTHQAVLEPLVVFCLIGDLFVSSLPVSSHTHSEPINRARKQVFDSTKSNYDWGSEWVVGDSCGSNFWSC